MLISLPFSTHKIACCDLDRLFQLKKNVFSHVPSGIVFPNHRPFLMCLQHDVVKWNCREQLDQIKNIQKKVFIAKFVASSKNKCKTKTEVFGLWLLILYHMTIEISKTSCLEFHLVCILNWFIWDFSDCSTIFVSEKETLRISFTSIFRINFSIAFIWWLITIAVIFHKIP